MIDSIDSACSLRDELIAGTCEKTYEEASLTCGLSKTETQPQLLQAQKPKDLEAGFF